MKRIFSFFAAAVVTLSLGLSGCANEDPADALDVDLNRTATLHGTILLNTDLSKAAADQKWSAPDITADYFTVTVPYNALNSGAAGTYVLPKDKITYNKSDGTYVITVPVGISNTTVTVKISDFEGTVKKADSKNIDVIWKASTTTLSKSVVAGETAYLADKLLYGSSFATLDCVPVVTDGANVY